jgi:hypothetical protein
VPDLPILTDLPPDDADLVSLGRRFRAAWERAEAHDILFVKFQDSDPRKLPSATKAEAAEQEAWRADTMIMRRRPETMADVMVCVAHAFMRADALCQGQQLDDPKHIAAYDDVVAIRRALAGLVEFARQGDEVTAIGKPALLRRVRAVLDEHPTISAGPAVYTRRHLR